MSEPFDAYHEWLGVPSEHRPPDHYALLGLKCFEADDEIIRNTADQRIAFVRTKQLGIHMELSQRILNELAGARACLLDPARKATYDALLRQRLEEISARAKRQARRYVIAGAAAVGVLVILGAILWVSLPNRDPEVAQEASTEIVTAGEGSVAAAAEPISTDGETRNPPEDSAKAGMPDRPKSGTMPNSAPPSGELRKPAEDPAEAIGLVIPKKIDVPKPVELPPAMKPADQRPRIRQIAPKTKVNGATPPDATLSDKSAPPPAIAPFDAATALKHQEAWAKHLGMPVRTTNSIAMKLVLIPPGEFTMGSSDSGKPARRNEKAEHRVRITKPFYLGSRAVTHAEYKQVVGYDPSSFRGDPNQPIDVNWEQAISFCRELSDLKGEEAADERYRLPTEAEWEYCCRAGMTTASGYSFDDDLADPRRHSRFSSKQRKGPSGGHQAIGPQPPWQLRPNAWGLHDMHGNVVEWCNDWFEDEPSAGVSGILVGFRVARTLVPSTSGSARSSPRSGTKASELSVPKGETTPSPSAGTVPK